MFVRQAQRYRQGSGNGVHDLKEMLTVREKRPLYGLFEEQTMTREYGLIVR